MAAVFTKRISKTNKHPSEEEIKKIVKNLCINECFDSFEKLATKLTSVHFEA